MFDVFTDFPDNRRHEVELCAEVRAKRTAIQEAWLRLVPSCQVVGIRKEGPGAGTVVAGQASAVVGLYDGFL